NGGVKPTEVLAAVYRLNGGEVVALSSRVRRLRLFAQSLTDGNVVRTGAPSDRAASVPAGD
ncbi:MAG TPA: hypothetical protein VG778_05230, partial [Blastocatellia bacterium]|nr:hypothetical protein [Blastocatellia bacterium]